MATNVSTFEFYRPLMFAIAYRMLGSAMEAEDIVQEAYLRYQSAENIETPKAFLSTVVTRLCLDQLKSARAQRETYIGPWLPEPLITPQTPFDGEYETISLAFLVVLENLTPVERAVFLLREVFDYGYDEIAAMVGKEEAACRQSFHRAKSHIAEQRTRFQASPEEHQKMFQRFMAALAAGDVEQFTSLLAEDVALWSDGGGKASAATRPLFGRDVVVRFLVGLVRRVPSGVQLVYETAVVNDRLALVIRDGSGTLFGIITFEVENGLIGSFRLIRNPDKLRRI